MAITLNAESIIDELWEAAFYTREQAVLVSALPAKDIEIAINELVDDSFWYAFDTLRAKVIDTLLEKIGAPFEMFPVILDCRTCKRETIHREVAGEGICGKCGEHNKLD